MYSARSALERDLRSWEGERVQGSGEGFWLAGTDHRIGSILDQVSVSAGSSGSKRILEVVYFAVLFWGRTVTGE